MKEQRGFVEVDDMPHGGQLFLYRRSIAEKTNFWTENNDQRFSLEQVAKPRLAKAERGLQYPNALFELSTWLADKQSRFSNRWAMRDS